MLTHIGAEGPMLGVLENNLIGFAAQSDPLIGQHGVLAYINGDCLSRRVLSNLKLDGFDGYIGIKLPKLQGQLPELFVLSKEYRDTSVNREELNSLFVNEKTFLVEGKSGYIQIGRKPNIPERHYLPTKLTLVEAMDNINNI